MNPASPTRGYHGGGVCEPLSYLGPPFDRRDVIGTLTFIVTGRNGIRYVYVYCVTRVTPRKILSDYCVRAASHGATAAGGTAAVFAGPLMTMLDARWHQK